MLFAFTGLEATRALRRLAGYHRRGGLEESLSLNPAAVEGLRMEGLLSRNEQH